MDEGGSSLALGVRPRYRLNKAFVADNRRLCEAVELYALELRRLEMMWQLLGWPAEALRRLVELDRLDVAAAAIVEELSP
jgi:hypothetical protein